MRFSLFLPALALLAGCKVHGDGNSSANQANADPDKPMVAKVLLTPDARDAHSYADPAIARVTHVSLDLAADFTTKRLSGTATLDIEAKPDADTVILDSNGLQVEGVTDERGDALGFKLGTHNAIMGEPLTIKMGKHRKVKITYSSAADAKALQWLTPEQTAGKKMPFLFSQGQAILNRSWIPTQDSPGIRQTWDARITVPKGMTAVMSADMLTPKGEAVEKGTAFSFRMDKPVAPYLIAIAVGDLAFKDVGARTGIWAEPVTLDKAAEEFSDMEKMVDAAEGLYGEYRWGRYDLLVLPPSFPYGGMENPKLTFATPTVIAGDKSLVSLVAHELAHSWSGNLVTNANWNDFWLNEGFTSYFETRIMEALYGPKRAAMLADMSWADMMSAIEDAGGMTAPGTRLHQNIANQDPDAGMNNIAYEKGATFLRTLEHAVGRERWDAYLKGYFDRHAFQPQTSAGFLADLKQHLFNGDQAAMDKLKVSEWVYEPGLPDNAYHWTSPRFAEIDKLAADYASGKTAPSLALDQWPTLETLRFINALPRKLPAEKLADLDRTWHFGEAGNSEIRFAWLDLAIGNRYDPALTSAEQFLMSQGRRKFVAPLFKAMWEQGNWGQGPAKAIYAKARPTYHPVTIGTVDKTLGWTDVQSQ